MRNGEGKLILDGEGSNNRGEERKMRHGNPPFNSVTYLCRTGETVKWHCQTAETLPNLTKSLITYLVNSEITLYIARNKPYTVMRECKYKRKKESNKLMMIKNFIYMIIFSDINKKEMHVHTSNTPTPPPNKSILENKIYAHFRSISKSKSHMLW